MFEYNLYSIYIVLLPTNFILFVLRVSSFCNHPNDASVDIIDDEGYFKFSFKAEFTSTLQETLKQNDCPSHNCHSVKNMVKLLVFIWLLNHLLLETECLEVMLIL